VWCRNLEKEEALNNKGCRAIKKSPTLKVVLRICVEVTVLLTWLRKELRKQMDTDVPNEKFVRVVITGKR
jgi:hypothetical protein